MEVFSNSGEDLSREIGQLSKLFGQDNLCIKHTLTKVLGGSLEIKNEFTLSLDGQEQKSEHSTFIPKDLPPLEEKKLQKRATKVALYKSLSAFLKKTLPWGSLTGVRPTKLAHDLVREEGVKPYLVKEVLERDFCVSPAKATLVAQVLQNQKCIIRNDGLVDLYINIPICPTRCLYCSFISSERAKVEPYIDKYISCLLKELEAVKEIIAKRPYIIRTIYIGGGTPSVLTAQELERLLEKLSFRVSEFTVECGRADTITEEKLDVLKKYGVTRISINPQTFNQPTLKRIGRPHKNSDVLNAYTWALERGFVINMDMIAGLPGERLATFKKSIGTLLELFPENVTLHTLSIKNGALLRDRQELVTGKDVQKMVDYGQMALLEAGYKPYYMYRQKNQLGGLENVGYFRDEHVCIFNIDSMEETSSVIAIGAGAMSKRVFSSEKKIERLDNPKFLQDYISRIDEIIDKKIQFFK